MDQERPVYYANELKPVDITEPSLRQIVQELEGDIQKGIEAIKREDGASHIENFGSIFSGYLGEAYAFLWLDYQSRDSHKTGDATGATAPNLLQDARLRIDMSIGLSTRDVNPGRPSPITSSTIGALVLRVLSGQWQEQDPKNLLAVLEIAVAQGPTFRFLDRPMGVDELVYGRAGLLWAILEIWKRCPDQETQSAFAPVFQSVHRLVRAIVDAGHAGAKAYRDRAAKESSVDMPLMWPWFDDFYALGTMHGISGVLGTLLDPALPRHAMFVVDAYEKMAQTISALCKLCIQDDGHLAMTVPPRPTSRPMPLVQICHGAPGVLTLLAAARRNARFAAQYWTAEWDEAIARASDVIWKQGLLSKGCSLCHGLAGNALSLLLVVDPLGDTSTDGYLAAALAMLLEAKSTPPFCSGETRYRMPDRPWSLFEGLAGVLCAWSEASLLIKLKLKVMDRTKQGMVDPTLLAKDEEIKELQRRLLGFPCLVGGVSGDAQSSFLT
ncbi:uncharacterized protein PV09_08470 [Verruconis gallopava]|uniref:Lanthionine synthetase C family protein n=1 Tax=Verruconis gallopava TaxID=253628 RepID=A0A0D1ZZZ6_9PEZI|nr:uncharacterized protein PV09_08470 [Verruconis gallopava]KIV99957.1 hypothetical protein PV09_08470 [Verruconis gallopava]